MRFFSDGSPGIIIPLENSTLPYAPNPAGKQGEMIVYGIFDHYIDIAAAPDTGMIIAVLQPYALTMLTGIHTSSLKNRVFPFKSLFPRAAPVIESKIRSRTSISTIISDVEDFLSGFSLDSLRIDPIVTESLSIILANQGNLTIPALLRHLPVSERQLERKFNHYIGVSPKKLSGLQRMTHFLKLLRSAQMDSSPLKYALQAGYYDQAHLNNHFKSLTGTTPLSYLNAADPLAINLFAR
jgi:AraC-like DNA-binding protein